MREPSIVIGREFFALSAEYGLSCESRNPEIPHQVRNDTERMDSYLSLLLLKQEWE